MKKILTLVVLVLVSIVAFGQNIDTLEFGGDNHLMLKYKEAKKIINPDTCKTDVSGNYSFLIYKGVEYYGIAIPELYRIKGAIKDMRIIRGSMLYNQYTNTIYGWRKAYFLANRLPDEYSNLILIAQ